ncbi:MAG: hypothetical protein WC095_00080 [Candidatus Paceibacterota bacterium]
MIKQIVMWLLVILVIGSIGFFIYSKSGSKSESNEDKARNVDTTTEESFTGSVLDLVNKGGNYECTFSHTTGVGTSNGTVYISGQKVRGNFVSEVSMANMTVRSYMISDETSVYTWTDMTSQGYKAPVSKGATEANTSQSFDYGQSLDYTCKGWVVDPSVFVLPSDIEFIEV